MLISELVATGWSGWFACRLRLQSLNQKWAKSDLGAIYIFRDEIATRGHQVMLISWIRRLFRCYSETIPRLQSETRKMEFKMNRFIEILNFSSEFLIWHYISRDSECIRFTTAQPFLGGANTQSKVRFSAFSPLGISLFIFLYNLHVTIMRMIKIKAKENTFSWLEKCIATSLFIIKR